MLKLGHAVHHNQVGEVDATKVIVATRDEVEQDVLWARRVLEHPKHPRHRATQVGRVQRHCNVDEPTVQ
jgi:hypothetical protein